ncbi:hypothetical protein [Amycolatopsis sp. PS_44_ISF1]|uniref:hypothetical protein n=1 Tax=Amycolatopsis sp. PS_44_ISF1 TaxID=2974917 RepID=UPI0028DE4634|nr:hypothetical protein [Amycolatopsis sp. PS_44_ISF1]MDT8913398.1 hypothetical protein [Amycolatopsis sp. PS_44_ISF1]
MTSQAPFDVEAGLRALIARGYQFVHPSDEHGEILAVVGVRAHGCGVDVIRLNAEDDVVAMRLPETEEQVLAPRTWRWRLDGPAAEVLPALLALPEETAGPAARSGGCWVPGRGGRAKWLATC